MATIVNPNPFTPGKMDKVWIKFLVVEFPTDARNGCLFATFAPYDGAGNLAATDAPPDLTVRNLAALSGSDVAVASMLELLVTQLSRLSGNAGTPAVLKVSAPDPKLAVKATAAWPNRNVWKEPDCWSACVADPQFANAFMTTMATVASLGGLSVTS